MATGPINLYILGVLAFISAVDGAVFLILYREMLKNPQVLMAKFKLNGSKTVRDFGFLLVSNIGLALSMAFSVLGVVYSSKILITASYIGQGLFSFLVVAVFVSWVKKYAIR